MALRAHPEYVKCPAGMQTFEIAKLCRSEYGIDKRQSTNDSRILELWRNVGGMNFVSMHLHFEQLQLCYNWQLTLVRNFFSDGYRDLPWEEEGAAFDATVVVWVQHLVKIKRTTWMSCKCWGAGASLSHGYIILYIRLFFTIIIDVGPTLSIVYFLASYPETRWQWRLHAENPTSSTILHR